MASWINRMIGAAKLDVATYEEVKADSTATVQAMCVVLLVLLSAVVSVTGWADPNAHYVFVASAAIRSILNVFGMALIGWVVWAFLIWLIGTKYLAEAETHAGVGPLMRALGFAASPGIIGALGWIPYLGGEILNVAWIWMFAASVVAIRQALNYKSTGRAILVCGIGWVVVSIIYFLCIAIIMMIRGI